MTVNGCIPLYLYGQDVTAIATATVTGKRFVGITTSGSVPNPRVGPALAGSRAFGVASKDAPAGRPVAVIRVGIVPVTAGADLAAGQAVQVDEDAAAAPATTGVIVGRAVFDAAEGADCFIDLTL
jgi:predicted RecA/RadA family phage recombinase